MENSFCEVGEKSVLAPKSVKACDAVGESAALSPTLRKPGVDGNRNMDLKFASQTPDKSSEPLVAEFEEGEAEVPERFVHIVDLFEGLIFALKMLKFAKKSPTFKNVSTQVNVLTKRKLSYYQLAQMKYILPEAIHLERILVPDKNTLCMKPVMEISLCFDGIEGHEGKPDFFALPRAFVSRLANYITLHPEALDIPLAILPYPFNQNKLDVLHEDPGDIQEAELAETDGSQEAESESPEIHSYPVEFQRTSIQDEPPLKSSHLSPSFKRRFSHKVLTPEDEKTQVLIPSHPLSTEASCSTTMNKLASRDEKRQLPGPSSQSDSSDNLEVKVPQLKEYPETPLEVEVKPFNSQVLVASSIVGESPKIYSAADGFMVTPAQTIPKRAVPSSDVKNPDVATHSKTCYQPVKRSLVFSESDECTTDFTTGNNLGSPVQLQQVINQTADGLSQPVKSIGTGGMEDHDTEQHLKYQQTSDQFRELVSLIHSIFQSVNYSSITKEELVYKILVNSFDFVERREVDEHIKILDKLVPDWIFNKLTPSGDNMYNINKMMDVESVCARITGA